MAQYKGSGTINGAPAPVGAYKFVIWAGGDVTDTFRVRIWWKDAFAVEHVEYDNGFDQG